MLKILTWTSITEGLKVEVITSLLPSINEKGAKVNATYKQPNVHTVATLDVFKVMYVFEITNKNTLILINIYLEQLDP